MKHNILVIGGTGKTGRRVVEGLSQLGHNVTVGSRKGSPAFGTLFKPNTSTAADGPANLILEPSLFTILLIFPIEFPDF